MSGKPITGKGRGMAAAACLVSAVWLVTMMVPGAGAAVPPGLVLHFDFDKAPADGVIPDQSGKKNEGTLAGAKWTTAGNWSDSAVPSGNGDVAIFHHYYNYYHYHHFFDPFVTQ